MNFNVCTIADRVRVLEYVRALPQSAARFNLLEKAAPRVMPQHVPISTAGNAVDDITRTSNTAAQDRAFTGVFLVA